MKAQMPDVIVPPPQPPLPVPPVLPPEPPERDDPTEPDGEPDWSDDELPPVINSITLEEAQGYNLLPEQPVARVHEEEAPAHEAAHAVVGRPSQNRSSGTCRGLERHT